MRQLKAIAYLSWRGSKDNIRVLALTSAASAPTSEFVTAVDYLVNLVNPV
jgi:hypothetical protein